ncbi:ABC transporter ATP-binding protein [Anaerosalibacter massiliensis]|uniref:ABC transporter ATP-binding protein n=1 Tax=Anaerosalibacter massiliensis TaxID=1347392 RepID=A0A9X2S654_9FIRM|nr:ABC transporter ATP-binding protein [Anaerosalibacter massiliensis]MCR2043247.1 ABC transporter ATP-binding protein [Anaerosalibacter massiliensis]
MEMPLISVKNLKKYFNMSQSKEMIRAVDGISFDIYEGETFGLVGESGCGKSTTGKLILRLLNPTDGEVLLNGDNILKYNRKKFRKLRKDLQIVFQNSSSVLDPKMFAYDILVEPLILHKIVPRYELNEEVDRLLDMVGLPKSSKRKLPNEFSGGQKQRLIIARALATRPKFIICDEPVSSLDVSIQSQILNLLVKFQNEYSLTYLFIAHSLNVVRHISNRVGVMYLGKIVEIGSNKEIFKSPTHPYTKALISAFPNLEEKKFNEEKLILKGEVPSPINIPTGCSFHTRCPYSYGKCKKEEPELMEITKGHYVSCFLIEKNL